MLRPAFAFSLLISITTPAAAQENSLFWEVKGSGSDRSSYLFGTVHSRDVRAYGQVERVLPYADSVQVVAGELDLEKGMADPIGLMGAMMLPEGKSLKELYKEKDWLLIEKEIGAQLGPMATMAQKLKPIFVMAMLTEAAMAQDEELVLDDHLLSTAKAEGHRVIGIETVEEQMNALDALPLKEQAALLLEHVKSDGAEVELNELMDAYAAQDLEAIARLVKESASMPKDLEKVLITDRNHRMVYRLDSIMQGGESILFCVGAAHLPLEDGLIGLLREKGYEVVPVKDEIAPRKEIEPAIEEKDR